MGKRTIWREVGERECWGGGRTCCTSKWLCLCKCAAQSLVTGLRWALLATFPSSHEAWPEWAPFSLFLKLRQKPQRMYAGVHTYMTTEGATKCSAKDISADYHSMLTWITLKISVTAAKAWRSRRHITVCSSESLHGYTNGSNFPSFPANDIIPNTILPWQYLKCITAVKTKGERGFLLHTILKYLQRKSKCFFILLLQPQT